MDSEALEPSAINGFREVSACIDIGTHVSAVQKEPQVSPLRSLAGTLPSATSAASGDHHAKIKMPASLT